MSAASDVKSFFATANQPPVSSSFSGVPASPRQGRPAAVAASKKGTLQNWNPRRQTTLAEAHQRQVIVDRALDLDANDPHVSGLIESMNINTVGIGFTAQSRINASQLPANVDAEALRKAEEWEFALWSTESDIQGTKHFNDNLALADRCMLTRGEYLILPRMVPRRGQRRYNFCLQTIDPSRLRTPTDLAKRDNIIDGVQVDRDGRPTHCWIQKSAAGAYSDLHSKNFVKIAIHKGHRQQVFHGFIQKDPDQYRGYVFFAPAMKFFRDLSDHLDAELVSNIVTSAAALWVSSPDPTSEAMAAAGGANEYLKSLHGERYEEVVPGAVFYGQPGQKPEVLEHNRPGRNFVPFVETILRAAAACGGIPYEVATRKYDKMNYSSARAALLDAWRVFKHRQVWLSRHFCQPCWDMVMEEAYLRNYFSAPGFYSHRPAYTRCQWIPQARGHVDPVKEIKAAIDAKDHNLRSMADLIAEFGGDYETVFEQREIEKQAERDKNIVPAKEKAITDDDIKDDDDEKPGK